MTHPLRLAVAVLSLLAVAPAARAAVITVDTTADTGTGNCTLSDAVAAANTDAVVDGCAAGSGTDEIDLTGPPARSC
jgi:hypothetical protein